MKNKASAFFPLVMGFLFLTLLVGKQFMRPFDFEITIWTQKLASKELDYFLYVFTLLGSVEFTGFVLLIVSWYLYHKYEWAGVYHYLFFFMVLSGVEFIWKTVVCYPGPGPEFDRNPFHWGLVYLQLPYSFPSGHTFRSAFLLGLWYQWIHRLRGIRFAHVLGQKILIWFLLAVVGFSRVYLGDHWLSDVVGGYLLAAIGLSLVLEPRHPELRPA